MKSHAPSGTDCAEVQRVVSCHALLECFSLLTRMPPPFRFSPEAGWSMMEELVKAGVAGGKIYDALIARGVFSAGAAVLLTWNVKDILRVAPPGLDVLSPEEYRARGSQVH